MSFYKPEDRFYAGLLMTLSVVILIISFFLIKAAP